jgi:3-oxoacyl-[acyl-carrier protein] reductase
MGRLDGKVAVVTGGASGIGREIARRYLAEGARVALGDLSGDLLTEAAAELGPDAVSAVGDVTEEADVRALTALAVEAHGRLDIGVNCAGVGWLAPVTQMSRDDWDRVLGTCLTGVFLSTKHEARAMSAGGVVVNIASINARTPAEGMSAYCAAKAAVEMFTRVAAMELGPAGIRVVGIGPGLVDTPLTAYQREVPAFRDAFLDSIPLRRAGTTADVAAAAVFLASDEASWVSGDTLFVDGAELTRGYPRMLDLLDRALGGEGGQPTSSS